MLSWILAVPLLGRDTNPSLWTVSFPYPFDKDDAQTVYWFLPWVNDLHVGAPVCQSECFWSCYICVWDCTKEIQFQFQIQKSSWEHWASTDLSMCCCLQSSFGVQAMNCASEKTWSLHLSYVLVMKSAWKKNSPGYSSRNSLPIFMAISIGSLSNFRLSGWLSCQQTGNPHQVLVHNSPLNYNYTSADTKILPLWLQASFGKRVSK